MCLTFNKLLSKLSTMAREFLPLFSGGIYDPNSNAATIDQVLLLIAVAFAALAPEKTNKVLHEAIENATTLMAHSQS